MQTRALLFTLAFASTVVAQSSLPSCAQGCANDYLTGKKGGIQSCGLDAKCICANQEFIADIACCVIDLCSQADQNLAVSFAQSICLANGVSVPNEVKCVSSVASTATTTAAATGTVNPNLGPTGGHFPSSHPTGSSNAPPATRVPSTPTNPVAGPSSTPSHLGNAAARPTVPAAAAAMGWLGGLAAIFAIL